MDSLERLGHSLEQAVTLIQSLRRENRDLAGQASTEARQNIQRLAEQAALNSALDAAKVEIERLRQETVADVGAWERAHHAENEATHLTELLEQEQQRRKDAQKDFEAKVHEYELKLLAHEREEVMPMAPPDRSQEVESLSRRCAELEVMQAQIRSELETTKEENAAMHVRIAESAGPEEVSGWQAKIHELSVELEGLRKLSASKDSLEIEKMELRKQKRAVTAILKEREMTRKKLEEIYMVLDHLRLD